MKQITPIPLKDKYWRFIRAEIDRLFRAVLFDPLFEVIKPTKKELNTPVQNASSDALTYAIANGSVWYEDGAFHGTFNAKVSKRLKEMGAKYDSRSETWRYAGAMPAEVSLAMTIAADRYSKLRHTLIRTLDDMNIESINRLSDIPNKYQQTIDWMEGDFQKAVKGISIPPTLTAAQRGVLAAEWGYNLDKYIKDWIGENIIKLRQDIQQQAFTGRRAESMVKDIIHTYQVGQRKAEFLARQETSLLMSKFHETRYKAMGINKYRWSGTMDSRERADHRALEGKIFTWDNPPVTDTRTGARNNPGEDFNCRCIAIPLLD